jgi:hypothetical protein
MKKPVVNTCRDEEAPSKRGIKGKRSEKKGWC